MAGCYKRRYYNIYKAAAHNISYVKYSLKRRYNHCYISGYSAFILQKIVIFSSLRGGLLLFFHNYKKWRFLHENNQRRRIHCFFAREKGVKIGGEYKTKKTYWVTSTNVKDKRKYNHPTIKPVPIIEDLINNSSKPGDVIFDPFTGSGTTAVAAKNMERDFLGFEIDTAHYNTALKRLEE